MNVQQEVNQPRTPATDSRALQSLIKAEKAYVDDLFQATSSARSAASSLLAWGMSETPDLEHASETVTRWLEEVARAQTTHAQALEGYRAALKDMLDREQAIRAIVRDRDILLNRVIKASKKKLSRREMVNGEEEHQGRLGEVQRELHACEQVLANETTALIGVKRRAFKEAFTMRMRSLGDTGAVMMDSARAVITYLDKFDANLPIAPPQPTPFPSELVEGEPVGAISEPQLEERGEQALPPVPTEPEPEPAPRRQPVRQVVHEPAHEPEPDHTLLRQRSSSALATSTPSKAAPVKRSTTSARRSRRASDSFRGMDLPSVPGGVPSAPKLNLDNGGSVLPSVPGGVPTAPRAVVHRSHAADDSSDEDMPVSRRRAAAVPSEDTSLPEQYHPNRRNGSFLSRVSHLFRSELKAQQPPSVLGGARSESFPGPSRGAMSHLRDDSSDEEPGRTFIRHERKPQADSHHFLGLGHGHGHGHSQQMHSSSSLRRFGGSGAADAPSANDDAIAAAARRSVIGEGIASRPASRQSAPTRPASTGGKRRVRRPSSEQGATEMAKARSQSAVGVPSGSMPRRSSTDNVSTTGSVTTRRKRHTASSGPPPAPSSYYVGFSNNPAKFATDTWVSKADPESLSRSEEKPTKVTGRPSAPPSRVGSLSKRASADAHSGAEALSLSIDKRLDGSGHLDLSLPAGEGVQSEGIGAAAADTYRAFLAQPSGSTLPSADSSGLLGMLGAKVGSTDKETATPAVPAGPSSRPSQTALQPALRPPSRASSAGSHTQSTKKSVRISAQTAPERAAPAPQPAAEDEDEEEEEERAPNGRVRSSWSTRIGRHAADDSSDEEEAADGLPGDRDAYMSARKAFNSATRHWGEATGTVQPRAKSSSGTQRRKRTNERGYNPDIQLPAGMQTLARSPGWH